MPDPTGRPTEPGLAGPAAATAPPVLEVRDLDVEIGGHAVLAGTDLILPAKGVDVLMGPVRAGKSTLLRALAGELDGAPDARVRGRVTMAGQATGPGWRPALVSPVEPATLRTVGDALVPAGGDLRSLPPASRRALAEQALRNHGLAGLAKDVEVELRRLSPARQRAVVILGRALAGAPLLMIDEPTIGLADGEALWLVAWLAAISRRNRMLVVMHHHGHARRLADRVILLGSGRVLAHVGTTRFFDAPPNEHVVRFVHTGTLRDPGSGDDFRAAVTVSEIGRARGPVIDAGSTARQMFQPPTARFDEPAPPLPPSPASRAAVAPPGGLASDAVPAAVTRLPVGPRDVEWVDPGERLALPARAAAPARRGPGAGDDASTVGSVIVVDHRGPAGFQWIVPGKLASCAAPGMLHAVDYDLNLLARADVDTVVTLTERDIDATALARQGLEGLHLPVPRGGVPTVRQAHLLARRLQRLMNDGHVVALHCTAGTGRTGTVLAAWLICEGGQRAAAALKALRQLNPAFVQSAAQERFLQELEEDVRRRGT